MKELVLKDATNSGDQTLSKRLNPLVEYAMIAAHWRRAS